MDERRTDRGRGKRLALGCVSEQRCRDTHTRLASLFHDAESDHTAFERLVLVPCASSACNKACRLPGTHKAALVNNGPCNSLGLTEINDLFECNQATAVVGMESIFTDEYALVNFCPTGCEPSPQDVRMEVGLNGQQYSRSGLTFNYYDKGKAPTVTKARPCTFVWRKKGY